MYRRFYECDPDLDLATSYIRERIERGESFIHVATIDGEAIGFVQSYPTFCSVDAIKRHVLYDLYVDESHRDAGVGAQLMDAARDAAIADGAKRVDLETAHDNAPGQHLYEKLGYERVEGFFTYSLALLPSGSAHETRKVQPAKLARAARAASASSGRRTSWSGR